MSHTPEPWSLRRNEHSIVICGRGKDVATVKRSKYLDNEMNEANARMIAAAPEMLALLQEIDRQCTLGTGTQEHIRAVIAKATGAQP